MITRIWHGITRASDADPYLDLLKESGIKDYVQTPGNLEVRIWRKTENDITHFWTVSVWENWECIKAFAGEDISKARYYPQDKDFLLDFEATVTHVETFTIK